MTALYKSYSNIRGAKQEECQYKNYDAISEQLDSLAIGNSVRKTIHKLGDALPL